RVATLAHELVGDREHVRRRDHDDARTEILDELHLSLGLPAGDWHDGAAEPFGSVVRAQPASEKSVTVCDVDQIARTAAGRVDRARDEPGPRIDVPLGVADDSGLAGSAR